MIERLTAEIYMKEQSMNNKELDNLYLEYINTGEDKKEQDCTDSENKISYSRENGPEQRKARYPKQSKKRKRMHGWVGILVGIVIGVAICTGAFCIMTVKSQATVVDMDYSTKTALILQYLKMYYLNDLDDQQIEDALAKGLMENIGDKYAEYYTEEEFAEFTEDVSGSYAGIGVLISLNDDGNAEVAYVYDGSPALDAGIQIKDLIVEADGVRDFETLDDLVSIVQGDIGTTVELVINRDGEEIPMTVERRSVALPMVYEEMLSDEVGYIQIAEFTEATVQQFEQAIDDLLEQGMTSVIFDLRDNPGGDYDSVVAMCDRVLPEGVIVSVEDKQGGIYTENSDAECLDIPIVVLVNGNTASAAELFTMALRDYDMAEIVGTKTYGKGVVQSIFRLIDGSGLKFTTQKYYGPKGSSVQDVGIEPDYVVELPEEAYEDGVIYRDEDLQLQKAAELLGLTLTFDETETEATAEEINEE